MAFNDTILHDVRGVTGFKAFGDGAGGWYAEAHCGIGKLLITNKPTVAFEKGVVCIEPAVDGKAVCDDAQLVAAYLRAFEGYNPFSGQTAADWASAHILGHEATFDAEKGPHDGFTAFSTPEAEAYLFDHGVFHPGVPV